MYHLDIVVRFSQSAGRRNDGIIFSGLGRIVSTYQPATIWYIADKIWKKKLSLHLLWVHTYCCNFHNYYRPWIITKRQSTLSVFLDVLKKTLAQQKLKTRAKSIKTKQLKNRPLHLSLVGGKFSYTIIFCLNCNTKQITNISKFFQWLVLPSYFLSDFIKYYETYTEKKNSRAFLWKNSKLEPNSEKKAQVKIKKTLKNRQHQ